MPDYAHPQLKKLLKCILESGFYQYLAQRRVFWVLACVAYPRLRDVLLWTGLMKHASRQPFLVGRINNRKSGDELKRFLEENGYAYTVLAWIDDGEVLSMRKCLGQYQFHIRLFNDGEIRAHYEHAPEALTFKHIFCPVVPKNKYFRELLADFLNYRK